ncbi:MAG TPA: DUF3465 domain-containing protein [Nitrospiria bacterium]|jgi:hypothetical protein
MKKFPRKIFRAYLFISSVLFLMVCLPAKGLSESKEETQSPVKEAYLKQYSNIFLKAEGEVAKILLDDTKGTPHQRFIIITQEGQTILIIHNLNLAPRVPVKHGLKLRVYGEYEWNPKGGVIHKTHDSRRKGDPHGWVEIVDSGKRFQ